MIRLEVALDRALANNLGLATQRFAVANAEDDIEVQEAVFDVELFGNTNYSESVAAARTSGLDDADIPESETRNASIGFDQRLSTGATVTVDSGLRRRESNNNSVRNPDYFGDVGISVNQPLLKDAWKKINLAPIARARVSRDISLFELRSDVLDLLRESELAYWDLAYAKADRMLIASSIELATNLLEENSERQRLGLTTSLEVLQAENELNDRQEDLLQAEREIFEALDDLLDLMGATSFLQPIEKDLEVAALPQQIPVLRPIEVVLRDAIDTDLEASAQERAIEVQKINRLLAEDEMRPDLSLVAGVAYSGRDTAGDEAFSGALGRDGRDWNVGLQLRFPWGFREAKARLRQAERDLERETWLLYELKQDKALATRTAWRAVDTSLRRITLTQKSLELNQEAFEQERARYGSGLVAYRNVLEAQRDFDSARRDRLSAVIETMRAQVNLSRIDGTILDRNGFTWERLDELATPPELDQHPLAEDLQSDS